MYELDIDMEVEEKPKKLFIGRIINSTNIGIIDLNAHKKEKIAKYQHGYYEQHKERWAEYYQNKKRKRLAKRAAQRAAETTNILDEITLNE